jgi:Arc/MetJ family transcription regulator
MRTNIEIDDKLMKEALKASGLRTKREVVEAALRQFVRIKNQSKILKLFGKVDWEGDLDAWRRDKPRT